MAKQGGMGDYLYIDEFDASGDIGSVNTLSGAKATQDVTNITQSAFARIGLLSDGTLDFAAFWNPTNGGGSNPASAHEILRGRPVTDRQCTYLHTTVAGAPAASLISKQVDYAGNRNQDGSLTYQVGALGNGYGLEWGVNLTAGARVDTVAGNGPTIDLGSTPVSYSFGWAAYLHVTGFTGTSVTAKVQDSADGVTFADLAGASFASATAVGVQRIQSASATATVRRHVRVVTSGTFTNARYVVNFVRYEAAGAPR